MHPKHVKAHAGDDGLPCLFKTQALPFKHVLLITP